MWQGGFASASGSASSFVCRADPASMLENVGFGTPGRLNHTYEAILIEANAMDPL